jgi:DNA-directed RNA polymerase subunit alpha
MYQEKYLPLAKPTKMKIKDKNCAIFVVEKLYSGYGTTLGNSLRRVLLSSIEGAAVTKMKIKGVNHEFSTIPGVLESALEIMLNLKKLRFKMISKEPQKVILEAKGEGEVKGKDFQLPAQLELVNKDCHIATLTSKNAKLEMEILVEKGIGYLPREERLREEKEVGVILVDAIFTPVKKVALNVEKMRVEKRTDFERLTLEVETDGTISPKDAFLKACDILISHFSNLKEIHEEKEKG